jgi:hypothetical protein
MHTLRMELRRSTRARAINKSTAKRCRRWLTRSIGSSVMKAKSSGSLLFDDRPEKNFKKIFQMRPMCNRRGCSSVSHDMYGDTDAHRSSHF